MAGQHESADRLIGIRRPADDSVATASYRPSMTDTTASPAVNADLTRGQRIEALDVLRGIAIIGTLASNIWIFTSPATGEKAQSWLMSFLMWLPNGKFLGLLTIMFGIGLEIQRQSAVRAGRRWPGTYPVRAALLFLDGVINYVLVVQFDVLRAYAVTGLIVAFLLLTSERLQWWLIGAFFTVHLAVLAFMTRNQLEGFDKGDVDKAALMAELEQVDTYGDNVAYTLRNFGQGFSLNSEFVTIVLMGIGSFLLGAKLYRCGIFEPARRNLRRWLIGGGFLVALPLDAALTHTWVAGTAFGGHARYGAALGVALGILALVAEFYQRRSVGWLGRQVAAVGAMALSCYLLQNILGVIIQYNLVPRVDVGYLWMTLGCFVAISVVMVVFARIWLRRFPRGPVELLWHWSHRAITRNVTRSGGSSQ